MPPGSLHACWQEQQHAVHILMYQLAVDASTDQQDRTNTNQMALDCSCICAPFAGLVIVIIHCHHGMPEHHLRLMVMALQPDLLVDMDCC